MLINAEEFFEEMEKEIRRNKYVLVEYMGTVAERTLSWYDTEVEAYRIERRVETKCNVIKADVSYIDLDGLKFLYSYKKV